MSLHVTFVSCDHDDDIFVISVVLELGDPLFNFVEGLAGDDLVDNDSSYSISVVDRGDCVVELLASGIPNGEFDVFIIVVGEFEVLLEIAGIDGGGLVIVELIPGVFESHGCFAHST